MHDDLCLAHATATTGRSQLHCWLMPAHAGDHYDRDMGVYWRHAPQAVREPARRRFPKPFSPRARWALAA
jgi:hypothetical protein